MIKKSFSRVMVGLILCFASAAQLHAADDNIAIASYYIGFNTGTSVAQGSNYMDQEQFSAGLKDFFEKKPAVYSQADFEKAGQELNNIALEKAGGDQKSVTQDVLSSLQVPVEIKNVLSYGSGYMYGAQLAEGGDIFKLESILAGFKDGASGKESKYTEEQIKVSMGELEKLFTKSMESKVSAMAQPNIDAGKKFMEEYRKQDGVKVSPEGMAYKVLKVGTGASPKPQDTVVVHYAGRLIDGTEFDSSIKRGEPATFPVQGVIDGWKMILPQMKIGDKWEVVIPQELAYGMQAPGGGAIKPGDTLIFEMELISIK